MRAKLGAMEAKLRHPGRIPLCFARASMVPFPVKRYWRPSATRTAPGTSAGGSIGSSVKDCWK